jgi:hypothetical protein
LVTNVKSYFFASLLLLVFTLTVQADDPVRKTIWQGTLHMGDNPEQYSNALSAGLVLQIPCKLDAAKKVKLLIGFRDIQTLAGEGHYAELLAHYEDEDGPGREYVVETFRLKDNSNNTDVERTFDLDPLKNLQARPAFYSIRIKLDTQIKFSLWDDFLMKRIEIEQ